MKTVLAQLNTVPGVVGSLLCGADGALLAEAFPPNNWADDPEIVAIDVTDPSSPVVGSAADLRDLPDGGRFLEAVERGPRALCAAWSRCWTRRAGAREDCSSCTTSRPSATAPAGSRSAAWC